MKFGPVAPADAEGAILAHGVRLSDMMLRKGRVLTSTDIANLNADGIETVVIARLDGGDTHEDPAAAAIATLLTGPGLVPTTAATGRVNLIAERAGVVRVDRTGVDALNRLDEAITLATVPDLAFLGDGQLAATIKIIPFAAPTASVEAACTLAANRADSEHGAVLRLAAIRPRPIGLIQTVLPGTKPALLDKTTRVLSERLAALGCAPAVERRCRHHEPEVADRIAALVKAGAELVLISGASAIVDRRDVIPAAIVEAGGRVRHFGMPVDPGNLLLLAERDAVPVIGLPGCARSPKLNGFDWVLQRLLADIPVEPDDITGLGVGGLLKEIPSRPLPRAKAAPYAPPVRATAPSRRVAAIILAAGQSRRMGQRNKMLARLDGEPLIRRAAKAALDSKAAPVVVVLGHQAADTEQALEGLAGLRLIVNPDFAEGMSTSLRAGIAALPEEVDAALVCLADMPRVSADALDRLIGAFDPEEGRAIVVPTHRGKRGNPVLFARDYFTALARITGDTGARHLIGEHAEAVCEVDMPDDAVLIDIDTPEGLADAGG